MCNVQKCQNVKNVIIIRIKINYFVILVLVPHIVQMSVD